MIVMYMYLTGCVSPLLHAYHREQTKRLLEDNCYDPKKPGQEKWLEHYTSHPRTSLATRATSRHKEDDWKGTFPEEGKHSPEGKIA